LIFLKNRDFFQPCREEKDYGSFQGNGIGSQEMHYSSPRAHQRFTMLESSPSALHSVGSGSWLTWANDIVDIMWPLITCAGPLMQLAHTYHCPTQRLKDFNL